MSSFPILDLVVGIIFIYFLLSIVSSSAVEMILTGLKVRSKVLEEWLCTIFDSTVKLPGGGETTLGQAIMDHCSVTVLSKKGRPPSYIDAKNFSTAIIERVTYNPENPESVARNIDEIIAAIQGSAMLSIELKRSFLAYAYEARDTYAAISNKTVSELEFFKSRIENWYDTSMDRLSGTLKTRYVRPFTLLVAVLTATALNADSISIAKYLYANPAVQLKLSEDAYKVSDNQAYLERIDKMKSTSTDSLSLQQMKENITLGLTNINQAKATLETALPLGWKKQELLNENGAYSFARIFTKITGLLATILAIFMGAPFWFDILNKIANLRGTGPKPASSTNTDNNN